MYGEAEAIPKEMSGGVSNDGNPLRGDCRASSYGHRPRMSGACDGCMPPLDYVTGSLCHKPFASFSPLFFGHFARTLWVDLELGSYLYYLWPSHPVWTATLSASVYLFDNLGPVDDFP